MKNIEKRQSWQLALSSIVLALTFAVIIISGYELFIAQSIVLFSFFILSRRIKIKMYVAATISATIIALLINSAMILWISPSLIIPLLWLRSNRVGINFILVLLTSLFLYSIVYSTAYAVDREVLMEANITILILLVIGESISASIICYLGDMLNERYE